MLLKQIRNYQIILWYGKTWNSLCHVQYTNTYRIFVRLAQFSYLHILGAFISSNTGKCSYPSYRFPSDGLFAGLYCLFGRGDSFSSSGGSFSISLVDGRFLTGMLDKPSAMFILKSNKGNISLLLNLFAKQSLRYSRQELTIAKSRKCISTFSVHFFVLMNVL